MGPGDVSSAVKAFVILLMVLFFLPAGAQQMIFVPPTKHLTMRDGLQSNSIRCLLKDSKGLYWIGTDAGLCTYNGSEFKLFTTRESFSGNKIWALTEDDQGTIWIGSFGTGLYSYHKGKFKHFTTKDGLLSLDIRTLYFSKKRKLLLIGTADGPNLMKNSQMLSPDRRGLNPRNLGSVFGFLEVKDFIYIASWGEGNNIFKLFPNNLLLDSLDRRTKPVWTNSSCSPIVYKGDTVWGDNKHGIQIEDRLTGKIKHVNGLGQVFGMASDSNYLWLVAWSYFLKDPGGLFSWDGDTLVNYSSYVGITDQEVWCVTYDKEDDLLWTGTLNDGLYITDLGGISDCSLTGKGLKNINALYEDHQGNLWISSQEYLVLKDTGNCYRFIDNKDLEKKVRDQLALTDNNRKNHLITRKRQYQRFFPGYGCMTEDKDSRVWISTFDGLMHADTKGYIKFFATTDVDGQIGFDDRYQLHYGRWGAYSIYPEVINGSNQSLDMSVYTGEIPRGNTTRILRQGDEMWLSTWDAGVYRLKDNHYYHYHSGNTDLINNINDLCFDKDGNLFTGDNTGNLVISRVMNDSLETIIRLGPAEGLSGNSINWLVYDKAGWLWIGTNKGINRLDLQALYERKQIILALFDEQEGYTCFSSKSALIDKNGILWVGGKEGLNRIDTRTISKYLNNRVKFTLSGFYINNKPWYMVLSTSDTSLAALMGKTIRLSTDQHDLVFELKVYNYRNSGKDRFRYFLEGFSNDWSDWRTSQRIAFNNLQPGHYKLRIEYSNLLSGISPQKLELDFRILSPFWQRWYWIGLFIVIISLLVWYIFSNRISRIKQEEKIKTELNRKLTKLEIAALQAQMNPHFIFNSINVIQSYILKNQVDDALDYLNNFSMVVRVSLENVSRQQITLDEEISFLKSFLTLEQMRFPEKFTWLMEVAPEINAGIECIPPMLLQPFIENAIRHGIHRLGVKGRIEIAFKHEEDKILLINIMDNGVGRKASAGKEDSLEKQHDRPHSTEITAHRIRLLNPPGKDLYNISIVDLEHGNKNPLGTKVEIRLPIVVKEQ